MTAEQGTGRDGWVSPAYFYLKRLDIEVIHPEQGDGVVDVEAQGKGAHEVRALLDGAVVGGGL